MEQQSNKETVARAEEVVGTTLQVPVEIWRRLRGMATDRRVSAQSLWLRAMADFLEREDPGSESREAAAPAA